MADFRDPERSVLKVREHRKRERRPFAARPGVNLPISVARGPVSRVLSLRRYPIVGPYRKGQPFLSAGHCCHAPATNPGHAGRKTLGVKRACRIPGAMAPIRSCSGWGLPCRGRCRRARCALAAPFHPCRTGLLRRGGLFSVALSLAPGPKPESRRVLPATLVSWSPDFPRHRLHDDAAARPPGKGAVARADGFSNHCPDRAGSAVRTAARRSARRFRR